MRRLNVYHLHSVEQAKNAMLKLYELFGILDVTAGDCQDALLTDVKDYEDAVVSCCEDRDQINYQAFQLNSQS